VFPYGGGAGLGFGLFYDPFLVSSINATYGSPYGGGTYDPFGASGPTGDMRLLVEPNDAEVFVDGFYVGRVQQFDGHFRHLNLAAGPHQIAIRAAGYEPLTLNVAVQAHHTMTYRAGLARMQP
jgi:hypothetical protein